jgi:two-component system LytT family response regulator
MRALIVDDEPLSRRAMRQLLRAHTDVEIIGECRDAIEAKEEMASTQPDVVFLDIRMPGLSGLELAADRTRPRPLIVFVSAYESYALPAFDVEAVDYVNKPVIQARLDRAVQRVRDRLASTEPPRAEHLTTRVRDRDVLIQLDTVDYIEADDVYAAVYAVGRRHLVRRSLDALERELDARFIRVHRSYIVRLDRISAIRQLGGGKRQLVLSTGAVIPASRRRWDDVDAALRKRAVGARES